MFEFSLTVWVLGKLFTFLIVAPFRLGPLLLSNSPAITVVVLVLSSDLT